MPASKLRVSTLSKSYGAVQALDRVNLDVREGEFLTLLGPSGSGKTTLLMAIAGFVEPSSGQIELDSAEITKLKPEHRNLGMVFQGYALFPHMTVAQNIAFPLKVRRRSSAEIARTVENALEMVHLSDYSARLPRQLSGGQQQRVALARALCFQPRMLLLDEPLAALDKNLRVSMQAEIKRLHRELGTTFIYVTHDQGEALSLSDRIAVFRSGKIEQISTPSTLYNDPASRFVASFLGDTNFLEGRVVEVKQGMVLVEAEAGRFTARNTVNAGVGDEALLSVRPEVIAVGPLSTSFDPAAVNHIEGAVEDCDFLGSDVVLRVKARSGQILSARILSRVAVAMGTLSVGCPVNLSWHGDGATLVTDNSSQ